MFSPQEIRSIKRQLRLKRMSPEKEELTPGETKKRKTTLRQDGRGQTNSATKKKKTNKRCL